MKLPQAERCASIHNMKIRHAVAALLLLSCSAFAQQKAQPQHRPQNQVATADRLGMTCAQILAMSSTDWVAKFAGSDASAADVQLRGIRVYGRCFDERTDQLAAALARKGTGPKKIALTNLRDFQAGMDNFTAKTLADTEPPADPVKIAYAGLYEKKFRYEFYKAYEQKTVTPSASPANSKPVPARTSRPKEPDSNATPAAAPDAKSAELPPAPKQAPLTGVTTKKAAIAAPVPRSSASAAPAKSPETESASKDMDPFTKAKNHFGELLGLLPAEKMHEVHAAFGKLFSGNPVSEDLKVEVYGYAIFLLERSTDKPFAPSPF
jgi:hypothetical protein